MADYYERLAVSRTATQEEIKKAYRKLALKYHPDRNQGDKAAEQKFKEVTEAYEVLIDPEKKARYDSVGHEAFKSGYSQPGGGYNYQSAENADIFSDLGLHDIFSSFFSGGEQFGFSGSRSKRTTAKAGSDLRYDIEITLEEAAFGLEKEISYQRIGRCKSCNGTGSKDGAVNSCKKCNGTGELKNVSKSIFGQFVNFTICDECKGAGKVIKNKCDACKGVGTVKESIKQTVKIPAGILSNSRVKVTGFGSAGEQGGAFGDLYIYVTVKQHDIFERKGNDVYCVVPVSFATAAIGGEVDAPTLSGTVKLKIPAGTQSGTRFKLSGSGIKSTSGYAVGDEIVEIFVTVPVKLNEKQKEALTNFDQMLKDANTPRTKSFAEKLAKKYKR